MVSSTLQPLFNNKSFWFAICLAMGDSAAGTVASIYGYSIILSSYPSDALIYYIVLQTIFTTLLRAIGLRFLAKNHKKSALIQYGGFVFFFLLAIILMQFKAYAIPFVVAILTSGITSLATIICWSILSLAFGMREYKTVAKYCNQAAYLSSIIFSFSVPLLVLFFSNTSLLIFVTLMLALCGFSIFKLKLYKEGAKQESNKKIKPKSIKYPIYYYMMIFTVLTTTIMGISQYIMRIESASYFTHEQLSSFFGYFSGITNCLGLLVASSSERVLKRLGLQGLLYSIPIIALINSFMVIFSPAFWSIIALGSIRSVFGYSYGAYGAEITLNILPANIRFITKANIKSTANIASMLLLVVFTVGKTSIYYLTWWIPPLSILALFFAYKVKQYYKITLQQESAFKRFNILEEISPATKPIIKEIALNAIKEKDTYTVFYGLDLINKLYANEAPPTEIYSLLEHDDFLVRYEIINLIRSKNTSSALPFLIARLPNETEQEIQRKLIEEIAHFDLNSALKICENSSNVLFTPVIKSLYFLSNSNNSEKSLQHLIELGQHPNPLLRKMVASLIGACKISQLSKSLKTLISDKENTVRDEAIRAAVLIEDHLLIPDILTSLLNNKSNFIAKVTLLAFGKAALPYLITVVFQTRHSKTITKLISAIPGKEAEESLINIAQLGTMYQRSIVAKYANERACKLPSSEEFKKKAYQLMEEELSKIANLYETIKLNNSEKIQLEIRWRIILAKILFIQWLAIATSPKEVNQLISSIVQYKKGNEQIFDKAIELLELYITDQKTRSYIAFLFENKKLELIPGFPPPYPDHWLEQIMTNSDQQSSLLSIVFELRSVRLFHDLPAEILLTLAEEIHYINFTAGEVIFAKNDLSDGLYCVTQGEVAIIRDEQMVATIGPHGFFGELALLDDEPRVASAVAKTTCILLFIEKDVFNRITDDVPDILRTVIKIILEYLRKNLDQRT